RTPRRRSSKKALCFFQALAIYQICCSPWPSDPLTAPADCATFCSATVFSSRKPLSRLEHLVMDVVWQRKSATAEDVRAALAGRHPMKESTVRTVLKRLEDKGYLTHNVEGRTNIYKSLDAPQTIAAKAVRQIID